MSQARGKSKRAERLGRGSTLEKGEGAFSWSGKKRRRKPAKGVAGMGWLLKNNRFTL